MIRFGCLSEGSYTLKETKAPAGYENDGFSLNVIVELNEFTMEYRVRFDGDHTGAGTASNPLVIENIGGYELPATGGIGTMPYMLGGLLMVCATLPILLYQRKHKKSNGAAR